VYWTTSYGAVKKAKKPTTSVPVGPTVMIASGQPAPSDIAVDATHVFWLNRDTGELMKVPK